MIDDLELQARITNSGIAYIYFHYKEQSQQTPNTVLCSLIKQLVMQITQSDLPKDIDALYDECEPKGKRPTFEALKTSLLAILQLFPRTFFVFDALDECEETQRKDLIPFFQDLGRSGASVFMTSRPYPRDIHESFTASNSSAAKIELAATEEDVTIYVMEKIEGNRHARSLIRDDFRKKIVAKLVKCCNGM